MRRWEHSEVVEPLQPLSTENSVRNLRRSWTARDGWIRTILNDASVGGMDQQHVGLRPAQDVSGHRAKPLVTARVQSYVANHQQIGIDVLGKVEQRVYRITPNGSRLDIPRPSRPGPLL